MSDPYHQYIPEEMPRIKVEPDETAGAWLLASLMAECRPSTPHIKSEGDEITQYVNREELSSVISANNVQTSLPFKQETGGQDVDRPYPHRTLATSTVGNRVMAPDGAHRIDPRIGRPWVSMEDMICGNCGTRGHIVEKCNVFDPEDGTMHACPLDNGSHLLQDCPQLLSGEYLTKDLWHSTVRARHGLAPVAMPWNWWQIPGRPPHIPLNMYLPHTSLWATSRFQDRGHRFMLLGGREQDQTYPSASTPEALEAHLNSLEDDPATRQRTFSLEVDNRPPALPLGPGKKRKGKPKKVATGPEPAGQVDAQPEPVRPAGPHAEVRVPVRPAAPRPQEQAPFRHAARRSRSPRRSDRRNNGYRDRDYSRGGYSRGGYSREDRPNPTSEEQALVIRVAPQLAERGNPHDYEVRGDHAPGRGDTAATHRYRPNSENNSREGSRRHSRSHSPSRHRYSRRRSRSRDRNRSPSPSRHRYSIRRSRTRSRSRGRNQRNYRGGRIN